MRRKIFFLVFLGALFIVVIFPLLIMQSGENAIYNNTDEISDSRVLIVFGAGLRSDGRPSDVLMDRLLTAAELFERGKATRILVSGDNRFENYNEPQVMHDVLVDELGIPVEALAVDYAGRRTFDTCARARELWGVDEAILVSQEFHLPRAIWTCSKLGIDSHGVSATRQPYVKDALFKAREWMAIYKAAFDVFILTPEYVKGEFEENLDE